MTFSERIVRFMRQLDTRELYRLISVALGIIILLTIFVMYRYYAAAADERRRMQQLNKQIERAQKILDEYKRVRTQKNKVDGLIARDSSFKIQPFFMQSLQAAGIAPQMSKEASITRHDLVDGYLEIRLEVVLNGLTMQQLVTLLQKLEENERVYIRTLRIVSTAMNTLDVVLSMATFEATVSVA